MKTYLLLICAALSLSACATTHKMTAAEFNAKFLDTLPNDPYLVAKDQTDPQIRTQELAKQASTTVRPDTVISKLLLAGTPVRVLAVIDFDIDMSKATDKLKSIFELYQIDIEKELLADFSWCSLFKLVDRRNEKLSMNEIRLALNGTTASSIEPGHFAGATHILYHKYLPDIKQRMVKLYDVNTHTTLAANHEYDLQNGMWIDYGIAKQIGNTNTK
jgi:hypothetical protein